MIRLLALAASAASAATFDGAAIRTAPLRRLTDPVREFVSRVPPELAAARSRVGVEATLARLAAAPARETFSFGVIGDAEPGRFPWQKAFTPGFAAFSDQLAELESRRPDFILQLGDFVSKGDAEHYRAHLELVERAVRTPLLRAVGNHDRSRPNGSADKAFYDAVFGPRDYFFDRGGWRFVSIDSSDRRLTRAQLDWLESVLAVPGRKVVFTHVPPAYLRPAGPPPPVKAEGYARDFLTNWFEDGAERFEALVSRGGVAAVYMGHIHAYWEGERRGVRYVISGGGGSPLYPLPPGYPSRRMAHYLIVKASPAGLEQTLHEYRGPAPPSAAASRP